MSTLPEVTTYLEALSPERRQCIEQVRTAILKRLPDAIETMHYNMPTYAHKGHLVAALASQKLYMSLYILPHDLLPHFADDIAPFNCGKSCIRFKKLEEAQVELLARIVHYASDHYPESKLYGKMPA